jgi:adhesin transport system outer membrane protein
MFVAKSAYTNAKYDELYSQFRILASGGALNSYLNVKLPEETAILPTNEPWIGASQKPIVTPTYATTIAE